ncbi:MAG: TonB-dependent receptor [Bacteroidota bacterium]
MPRWITILLAILAFCWAAAAALAQTATITGSIHDQGSGEELVGAHVLLIGTTKGTTTDLEGKFEVRGIEPGIWSIRFSYVGYAVKVVTDIKLAPGQTLQLDILLEQHGYTADEVVITAEKILSTDAALLSERKRSATIGDALSAESVKRSPDATTGDALKRVTGLSIVDNKFVFIRGITDRYNGATLDGASVASTAEGKKGFSFDLVPAGLLENTVVVKSATPELPGDFTGGLVQMSTLDFPDRFVARVTMSGSYNTQASGKVVLQSAGGSKDWMGADDGSRVFPDAQSHGDMTALARAMQNTWAPHRKSAPLNGGFSISLGGRQTLGVDEGGTNQLGFVGALSYSNGMQRSLRDLNDISFSRLLAGTHDAYDVLWGGIANVSVKLDGLHKFSFRNSYNRSATDEVRRYHSDDGNTSQQYEYTILSWNERSIYTGQLTGEHTLPGLGGTSIQWRATVSSSHSEDPDRKEVAYYRALDAGSTDPYYAATNKRSWAHLNDRTVGGHVDVTVPLEEIRLKAGGVLERRESNYGIRYFTVEGSFGMPDSLLMLPLEDIYTASNFGPGKFMLRESSKPTDSYNGDRTVRAAFAMLDVPVQVFDRRLRIVGGVRLEESDLRVNVPRSDLPDGPFDHIRLRNQDLLPSVNLTYALTENTNVRAAYAESVNRPEFREGAPVSYFDYVTYESVGGNPSLQRAYIHNYDLRFEIFPGIRDLLALSVFHKSISGAIEEQLFQTATRTRTWFNSSLAQNTGYEVEVRSTLSFLGPYGENFGIAGNYTRVNSRVEYVEVGGNSISTTFTPATRPMQGQSPFMINLALTFTEPGLGTSVSVLYNKFGRRLTTVGFLAEDIYEEPRDLVDLAVTQPLWWGIQAKLTIKNVGDKERVLTQGGIPYESTSTGRTFGLSLSMNL